MGWGWGEAYFPGFPPRSGLMLFPPLMSYLNTYIPITTSFCQVTLQDQAQSPLMPSLTSPGEWQGPPLSPACLRPFPTLTCLPHQPVDSEGRMWVLGAQHRARYTARAGKYLVNSGGKSRGDLSFSHSPRLNMLLWLRDSALALGRFGEKGSHGLHLCPGPSTTSITARGAARRTGSYLGQSLHHCVQQGPHPRGHLQQLQHCGQDPARSPQPRPVGMCVYTCVHMGKCGRKVRNGGACKQRGRLCDATLQECGCS